MIYFFWKHWKGIALGLGVLLLAGAVYVGVRRFIPPVDDARLKRIEAAEKVAEGYRAENAKLARDVIEAKVRARVALERAEQARVTASRAATTAEGWRAKVVVLEAERAKATRIETTQQALDELRRLGWLN